MFALIAPTGYPGTARQSSLLGHHPVRTRCGLAVAGIVDCDALEEESRRTALKTTMNMAEYAYVANQLGQAHRLAMAPATTTTASTVGLI